MKLFEGEALSGTITLFSYKDPTVKSLLRSAKYDHHEAIYRELLEHHKNKIIEKLTSVESELVIPIPSHWRRTLWRGGHHTKALANELSKLLAIPCATDILIKNRYTKRQALLTRKERLVQQKDSFLVRKDYKLLNKNILLVDDISTTGSTFLEAERALYQAGAKKVTRFALAH